MSKFKVGDKAVVTGPLKLCGEDEDYGSVHLTLGEEVEILQVCADATDDPADLDVFARGLSSDKRQYIDSGSLVGPIMAAVVDD